MWKVRIVDWLLLRPAIGDTGQLQLELISKVRVFTAPKSAFAIFPLYWGIVCERRKAEALFISTAPPLARELSEVTQPASVGVGLLQRFGRTIGAKPDIAGGAVADALQAAIATRLML